MGKRKRRHYEDPTTRSEDHNRANKRVRKDDEPPKPGPAFLALKSEHSGEGAAANSNLEGNSSVRSFQDLEPPAGSSRRQRKVWRKRQRRLLFSRSAGFGDDRSSYHPASVELQTNQALANATEDREAGLNVTKSLLKQLSITSLVAKPEKIWHDGRKSGPSKQKVSIHMPDVQLAAHSGKKQENFSKRALKRENSKPKAAQRSAKTLKETSWDEPDVEASTNERSASDTDRIPICKMLQDDIQEEHRPKTKALTHAIDRASLPDQTAKMAQTQSRPAPTLTTTPGTKNNFGLPLLNSVSGSITLRSSSFGNKPTSVPSFSDDTDVSASFAHFSAFLRGKAVDSSDDDVDESEDESEDDDPIVDHDSSSQAVMEYMQDNVIDAPNKANDAQRSGDDRESDDQMSVLDCASLLLATAEQVHDEDNEDRNRTEATAAFREEQSDEKAFLPSSVLPANVGNQSQEGDALPKLSQSASRPTSGTTLNWPANVGIKRQGSSLGHYCGDTPSRLGTAVDNANAEATESNIFSQSIDPFDVSDDGSEDVLQAIDEVSKAVFGSTRPLPSSKPLVSPGPNLKDQENGLITTASSNRRVTRSMSITPKKSTCTETVLAPQPPTIVYNTVYIPDVEETTTSQHEAVSADFPASRDISDDIFDNIDVARSLPVPKQESESSLSELSRSPTPPDRLPVIVREAQDDGEAQLESEIEVARGEVTSHVEVSPGKRRKMTGTTSKHFSTPKRATHRPSVNPTDKPPEDGEPAIADLEKQPLPNATKIEINDDAPRTKSTKIKRKSTGTKSTYFTPPKVKPALDLSLLDRVDLYNTTAGNRNKRVPAGTSTAPVPPITSVHFGIIQEKLWQEPFWLLIAVTFLNKTTGRAAVPTFWALKQRYATPELLAQAEPQELQDMIHHLGLQRQRSKRLIAMAHAWIDAPPVSGIRWRTLHYPCKGDGKVYKMKEAVEEDAEACAGALEIGHIPGCGPYAWDSWRIFCRDVLRGVAEDYNGKNNTSHGDRASEDRAENEGFEPEWQKVVPLDKELRACLRWMWLREGWIWDPETGEKRAATEEEMENAVQGEMEIADPLERKFAAQAAGMEPVTPAKQASGGDGLIEMIASVKTPELLPAEINEGDIGDVIAVAPEKPLQRVKSEEEDASGDNIVVSRPARSVKPITRLTL